MLITGERWEPRARPDEWVWVERFSQPERHSNQHSTIRCTSHDLCTAVWNCRIAMAIDLMEMEGVNR